MKEYATKLANYYDCTFLFKYYNTIKNKDAEPILRMFGSAPISE